jgi:steroid delta-isomerase-like uncharacterized protein
MEQKSVVDLAKEQILAYNEKNWDKVRAVAAKDLVYDEIATHRRVKGLDDVLETWKGWAAALPDSKATFVSENGNGNTATIEVKWTGTHRGTLKMPGREIPPTGKTVELQACQVVEVAGDKVKSVRHYFDMGTLLKQIGVDH